MNNDELLEVLDALIQLQEDDFVPRNIKARLQNACTLLKCEERTVPIRVDESIQELDEIAEDNNIPIYTRTQIWDIVAKLECIK